jgi:hypothetical protein
MRESMGDTGGCTIPLDAGIHGRYGWIRVDIQFHRDIRTDARFHWMRKSMEEDGIGGKYIQDGIGGKYIQDGIGGKYIQDGIGGKYIQDGIGGKYI